MAITNINFQQPPVFQNTNFQQPTLPQQAPDLGQLLSLLVQMLSGSTAMNQSWQQLGGGLGVEPTVNSNPGGLGVEPTVNSNPGGLGVEPQGGRRGGGDAQDESPEFEPPAAVQAFFDQLANQDVSAFNAG